MSVIGERAELWENVSETDNNWLILKLVGTKSNRDGNGARVFIGKQYNQMTTSVSYASSTQYGVHFGLGKTKIVKRIEIHWPSGVDQVLENVKANQVLEVKEPGDSRPAVKAKAP